MEKIYRRNLQRVFVNLLDDYLNAKRTAYSHTDLSSILLNNLVMLRADCEKGKKKKKDLRSRYHLQELIGRIDGALNSYRKL